jgi:hypothetical protein
MKSSRRGTRTSHVEVGNVSRIGFWLLLDEREVFVPFKDSPWFRDATIGQLIAVERPHASHLHWPELDVDLAVESLDHPERFPLISPSRPKSGIRSAPGAQYTKNGLSVAAAFCWPIHSIALSAMASERCQPGEVGVSIGVA